MTKFLAMGLLIWAANICPALAQEPTAAPTPPQTIEIPLEKAPHYEKKKIKIEGPAILDARDTFEYSMGHAKGAQSIRWEDYAQTEEPHKGALDPDSKLLARKLRLLGVEPERETIVLGNGVKGHGEEGRIGWMLKYLGVKKIKVMTLESFGGKKMFGETQAVEGMPLWLPKADETLRVRLTEMENLVQTKPGRVTIIDVRAADAFRRGHLPNASNIPWQEFVSPLGTPVTPENLATLLKKHDVDRAKQLVFYSENGVSSGYATFAAAQGGLSARNYDGSFQEWSAIEKHRVENSAGRPEAHSPGRPEAHSPGRPEANK